MQLQIQASPSAAEANPTAVAPQARDSYAVTTLSDITDRSIHAAAARFTLGLSPAALMAAWFDWAAHLAAAPGKRLQLVDKAARKALRLANHMQHLAAGEDGRACIEPLPQDKRFAGAAWQHWPFNLICQGFLLQQQWWHNATTGVRGVTDHHEAVVSFTARQLLDVVSPSNFLFTNPELLQHTLTHGGSNLATGLRFWMEDWERTVSGKKPIGTDAYRVGHEVAASPGRIVLRNRLIELIQYAPTTDTVHPEPILIVPAWIMKYYILDLSQRNSLVKYLTDQGFTVFMISWKNPSAADRDLGMEDYRRLGIMAALATIGAIVPGSRIHALGYCLGGTLLSIAAAAMARDDDRRLATLTLLAAQTDFTEAGELTLFIDDSQLAFLEDVMWEQGFLDARQMAGAFQILRSNDLIWSESLRRYLRGERAPLSDLMAWNADATRMPYRMHSEYLRGLFLNNDLAEGRYRVEGRPVVLSDIDVPIFAVGTEWDHVAPWRSTYKVHLLTDTEVHYLLVSGGHNAGIVSEPGRDGRHYRTMTRPAHGRYVDPQSWTESAAAHEGSWWPELSAWLAERSGRQAAPPAPAPSVGDAPGLYVLES